MLRERFGITVAQLEAAALSTTKEFDKARKKHPDVFGAQDTTTTTTMIGAMMAKKIARLHNLVSLQPKEKGYPDLVCVNGDDGIDVKCTVNNSFAAHHVYTKNILTIRWKLDIVKNTPVIYEVGCMLDLTPDNFTQKKDETNTRNTPVCHVKEVQRNKHILWSIDKPLSHKQHQKEILRKSRTLFDPLEHGIYDDETRQKYIFENNEARP